MPKARAIAPTASRSPSMARRSSSSRSSSSSVSEAVGAVAGGVLELLVLRRRDAERDDEDFLVDALPFSFGRIDQRASLLSPWRRGYGSLPVNGALSGRAGVRRLRYPQGLSSSRGAVGRGGRAIGEGPRGKSKGDQGLEMGENRVSGDRVGAVHGHLRRLQVGEISRTRTGTARAQRRARRMEDDSGSLVAREDAIEQHHVKVHVQVEAGECSSGMPRDPCTRTPPADRVRRRRSDTSRTRARRPRSAGSPGAPPRRTAAGATA